MNNYLIYKHTSPSGKAYIGQTNDYQRRCRGHKYTGACRAFSNAIKKYGWSEFKNEILVEGLSKEEANRMEKVLINEHKTYRPYGYNLMSGGDSFMHSEETKEKMSIAKLGVKHGLDRCLKKSQSNTGRVVSAETRLKISDSLMGHIVPESVRLVLSEKNKGNSYAKGYKHTKEALAKIIKNNTGRKLSEETRRKMSETHKRRQQNIRLLNNSGLAG